TDSLDKPWKDNQKHKDMMTTVGKILLKAIMPEGLPYLQEPNNANMTEGNPYKYFLEPGSDIKDANAEMPNNPPLKKK
ncbi:DNA-directed RNA polymerase subunit beta', partial [Streptococcus suis]